MKIVKIEAQYSVKLDFIKMLNMLIKEINDGDIIDLEAEYASNFGGKLKCEIKNIELTDLREKNI